VRCIFGRFIAHRNAEETRGEVSAMYSLKSTRPARLTNVANPGCRATISKGAKNDDAKSANGNLQFDFSMIAEIPIKTAIISIPPLVKKFS
jgi:hypothetical protein